MPHPPHSWRRRLPRHHVPLALASGLVFVLFMTLPTFNAARYHAVADIFSGALPQQRTEQGLMDHRGGPAQPMNHGPDQAAQRSHGGNQQGPMDHGAGQGPSADQMLGRSFAQRSTVGTGYIATGLLALTLLIGPANLLRRRRNPVSSYLRRDAGTWTVIVSIVHTILGLQVHGSGQLSGFLDYFLAPNGAPRLNSFGLANWTGLAALVIAAGLLTLSSDLALRKFKPKRWKRLQRTNYALFALVIAHAFFYGALVRTTSPFTLILVVTVIAVLVGQAVGVWQWRRKNARATTVGATA
jgi:sulfoxide reductase heme-binding subunit YedZ